MDDGAAGRSGAQPDRVARLAATVRSSRSKVAALAVLAALVLLPAPLLPPLAATRAVESALGASWSSAYLVAAIALHVVLYGSIGIVAAFAVGSGETRRGRLLRLLLAPIAVAAVVTVVRSVKLGHVPPLQNAAFPLGACAFGVVAGMLLRQHGWRATLAATGLLAAGVVWGWWPVVASDLGRATQARLERLVAAGRDLPAGDERFCALLERAFAPGPPGAASARDAASAASVEPAEDNRAALLALGIAIGHERLARYAGLDPKSDLVRSASTLRDATTLRGRKDWPRHFFVSATLSVVENQFLSDTGGLLKEELDALTHGTGFSFADLAADRAGARFAHAATESEAAARTMQQRIVRGLSVDDLFPPVADLPENLTLEEFRRDFGGVGSLRYREKVAEIEARLDRCSGLVAP